MRYQDPQLQEQLAAEYAVGALRGAARARFEALLQQDAELRRRVAEWQERLAPLAEETPDVAPAPRVRRELLRRLSQGDPRSKRWWEALEFWRPAGAVAMLAAVVLAVLVGVQASRPSVKIAAEPHYVALLSDRQAHPALVVIAHVDPWRLTIEPVAPLPTNAGQVLQVWAVEEGTQTVRPLVRIFSQAPQRVALTKANWDLVRHAETLIVSVEPADTMTAAPTGAILYSGPCINLKGPPAPV